MSQSDLISGCVLQRFSAAYGLMVLSKHSRLVKEHKAVPLHAVEAWVTGGIAATPSSPHYMGVSGGRDAPTALYPRGKDPQYPRAGLDTEARGKVLHLPRVEPQSSSP